MGKRFLRNVGAFLPDYAESHYRRRLQGYHRENYRPKFIMSEATKYFVFTFPAASKIGNGDRSRRNSGNGVALATRSLQNAEVKVKVELFLPLCLVVRYREDL
jgi:hypothetical protein